MKIHFVGIGGIGISALARLAKNDGHTVSGSDISSSLLTKKLESEGISVTVPHCSSAIESQDLLIHSAIIKEDNPEIQEARKNGIKILSRKEALPEILKDNKVYSVCGAHGKSTTTAILASILKTNAIIGAESKEFGSNVHFKEGDDRLVFEADESDGSFVYSNPHCSIVTNAEPEHMENYNYDMEKFHDAYREFLNKAKIKVINCEDEFLRSLEMDDAIKLYPDRDIKELRMRVLNGEPYTSFSLKDLGEFNVWGFGSHIAVDASLAILAALNEVNLETIKTNLKDYRGIKKRFDIVRKEEANVVIDDYGHHPTEIKATMDSALEFAQLNGLDKITAIWQPHKYSRTEDNLEGFINCFKGVDNLVILPVWEPSQEKRDIDFRKHFSKYNPIFAEKIIDAKDLLDSGLVIGFGAGDITTQIRKAVS